MGWDDRPSRSSRSYSNGRANRYSSGRNSRTVDIDPLGIHIDVGSLADIGGDIKDSLMQNDAVRSTVEPVYGFVKESVSTGRRIVAGINWFFAFMFFCVTLDGGGHEPMYYAVGFAMGAICARIGFSVAGITKKSGRYAGKGPLRTQLAVLCALVCAALVVALLKNVATFPPVQSVMYAVTAIVLIICICLLVNVPGIIAELTHQKRKTERYQTIANVIPAAVDGVFDGWRPRQLDLKKSRATAPAADGSWKPLGRANTTFKMSEKDVASFVCADILLMARTYAEQDVEAGEAATGRFVYRETFNVVPAPEETRVMAELMQRLTQCGTVVYYEGLDVDVREGRGQAATCSVAAKITIAV